MEDFTPAMVDDLFCEDEGETVLLVTLTAPGLAAPFLASSHEAGIQSRAGVAGGPVLDFPYFPFALTFGGASADEPSRDATLEISNADGLILQAIRTATGVPTVTVQAVRVSDPDYVELTLEGAPIVSAQATEAKVSAAMRPRTFADEPAVAPRYTLTRTPSLA